MAMGDYPYAQDLFGQGLPAWPLRRACRLLSETQLSAPRALGKAVGSYYNATGGVRCHSISAEYRDCADQTGCGAGASPWGRAWDAEACRQIVYFTPTDNVTDMFPPRPWGPEELGSYCKKHWDIQPQSEWFRPWWSAVEKSSRIIFTNGLSDPWRGGGVLESLSSTLVALHVLGGAHIYDLAASHPQDLPAVRDVRQRVISLLRTWLSEQVIV
ncbi:unnamed protein product [Effrenium voratum]|nr:unnamed protein product [Effrenium voratum]